MKIQMSQMPNTSALVADYLDAFDKVAEFYNGDYRDVDAFLSRSDEIKSRDLPIGKLIPILKEQNQRYGCGVQTFEKVDWLLERRACAVVTGQQTGLFSGPLYTIYKALTAIKLAARLSRTCEGCYVPVFWLASDDHDFREVNHINIVDKSNQVLRITYDGHPFDGRIPVANIQLNDQIAAALQKLDDETHLSDFKAEVLARLSDAYQPGSGFSESFARWLMTLFKPFGLVLIDASDPRIKALGAPIFQKEMVEKSGSTQRALEFSSRLMEKNYHSQVQLQEGLLNLFFVDDERRALGLEDETYVVKGSEAHFKMAELLSILQAEPEKFSPNVLLRPIYQDGLLPTVAYVAGPAEIAYYAQMKGIYESFDLPMPIIYPRKSVTLLEGKIEKVLDNYNLSVPDFWGDVEQLINQIAKTQLPETVEKRIENASLCVKKNLQALEQVVQEFEPTLNDAVKGVRNKIDHQIDGLEKKILQAYKKRNDIIRQQLYKAGNNLYPNNSLQERELNVLPYLFKYGFPLLDRLYEVMDISNFDHQIIRL